MPWQACKRRILLFLRGVKDRPKILVADAAFGRIADWNFSSSQSLFLELDRAGAIVGGVVAGEGTADPAALRRRQAFTGETGAGVSTCLHLRDYLVCRNLLLDLQY